MVRQGRRGKKLSNTVDSNTTGWKSEVRGRYEEDTHEGSYDLFKMLNMVKDV